MWVENNIIFFEAGGGWNLEMAKEFIRQINQEIAPQVTPPYTTVGILKEDWMPTAEAIPYLNEATKRAIRAGLVREAYVTHSPIAKRVSDSLVLEPDCAHYQSKSFDNLEDALAWLTDYQSGAIAKDAN